MLALLKANDEIVSVVLRKIVPILVVNMGDSGNYEIRRTAIHVLKQVNLIINMIEI